MPIIDVTIGQRNYELACDDGEQNHIRLLAKQVSARIKALENALGKTSDNKLLAIACLMLEEELRSNTQGKDTESSNAQDEDLPSVAELQKNILEPMVLQLEALAQKVKSL